MPGQKLFLGIPARLSSERLARKLLLKLGAETIVERVARRAAECAREFRQREGAGAFNVEVIVATDSAEIADSVAGHARVIMTDGSLPSGTMRLYAALKETDSGPGDLVVNIQADEPFFAFEDIFRLVDWMEQHPKTPMATLAYLNRSKDAFLRSSVVKVVCDGAQQALYFSRAPMPWPRGDFGASGTEWLEKSARKESAGFSFLQHVGIYAYRFGALVEYATVLPKNTLEDCEGLEQLRALFAGWKVGVVMSAEAPVGIDTAADLERARVKIGEL